jgi:hypothetical protein
MPASTLEVGFLVSNAACMALLANAETLSDFKLSLEESASLCIDP